MINSEKLQVIENLEKEALKKDKELEIRKRNFWIAIFSGVLVFLLALLRQAYFKRKRAQQEAQLKLQEERLRISRDLHDNIGAELSYMSSVIDQKLYNETNEDSKKDLEQLGATSKNAMAQLRETIWAVQTEEITLNKFADKLKQLSRKYTQHLSLDLEINLKGLNYKLEPAHVISLFRICQEALNNAVKYANCSKIQFEISGEDNWVKISIKDNGVGFDTETVKRGYGLNNIEERIKEMNGTFKLTSKTNRGTRVEAHVPI